MLPCKLPSQNPCVTTVGKIYHHHCFWKGSFKFLTFMIHWEFVFLVGPKWCPNYFDAQQTCQRRFVWTMSWTLNSCEAEMMKTIPPKRKLLWSAMRLIYASLATKPGLPPITLLKKRILLQQTTPPIRPPGTPRASGTFENRGAGGRPRGGANGWDQLGCWHVTLRCFKLC